MTADRGRRRHCVLAGAPRCASTSLFEYLAAHPDVAPSHPKQTGYFLDPDYEGVGSRPVVGHVTDPDAYPGLFPSASADQIRLEATPDYLYSSGTPDALHRALGDTASLLFVLRNPVDQFVSGFYHNRSLGRFADLADADAGVEAALTGSDRFAALLLERAAYTPFVRRFVDRFGAASVRVIWTEELARDPHAVLASTSRFLDLDAAFYDGFAFERLNASQEVRSRPLLNAYRHARRVALFVVSRSPLARRLLMPIASRVAGAHRAANTRVRAYRPLSAASRARLVARLAPDVAELGSLLGRCPPWADFASAPDRLARPETAT